ncbi:hypothetical protein Acsp05_62950 [Actinokineospora sp. NBRC 105648]|nr:hypothetical protein Acsp05_62950 [Actinokineospora sp. NBRC 105648]
MPAAVGAALGAGALLTIGPAAGAAGWWTLAALPLAALVALLTAVSFADLAAQSGPGGIPAHVTARLGEWPGRLAGVLDLSGRLVAGAAVAGAAARYLLPGAPGVAAAGLVAVVVAPAAMKVAPAPTLLRVAGLVTIVTTLLFVTTGLAIEPVVQAVSAPAGTPGTDDPTGLLTAAGVLFFGFLGAERAGGPRARVGVVAVVLAGLGYLLVAFVALRHLGGARLALSPTPLRDALAAADGSAIDPLLTLGIAVGAVLALHVLLTGAVGSAAELVAAGELPGVARGPVLCAAAMAAVALVLSPTTALALAATLVLGAHAFVNSAARQLCRVERSTWVRTGCCGLALSVIVGVNISLTSLLGALAVLGVGTALCAAYARRGSRVSAGGHPR